ncbi:MAG: hypothetical protein JETT_0603 [Candidatus Jettenia ecosi]|uniref:YhcG N-terminal domain-containing protein n=1 Tax=Candidatus Jettenia ecosi TaxID=2494326 RepID=A0A533QE47_9BACT|nr:MAG: hypothetical protein JETT_0603 [Candidatus Jettenia ecosi]
MKNSPVPTIEQTYKSIKIILEKARSKSFKAVNTAMVRAYWHAGKIIIEGEQQGKQRAQYGASLIEELAKRLTVEYGQGFNKTNLWYMKQFYLTFQNLHALRGELTWTHYRLLLKIEKREKELIKLEIKLIKDKK